MVVAEWKGGTVLAGAFTLPPLANVGIGTQGVAYLVDSRGTIIAHPDPSHIGENLGQHPGVAQVVQGESGAALNHTGGNSELVVGYAPIPSTHWGLVIEEPWADVIAPMFQFSVLLPLVLLLVAIISLIAIYFGIRNVHRPMQRLAQAANRIAFGDYDAAAQPVGGIREVEELRETLDRMAHQVQSAQEAMRGYVAAVMRGQEEERMRLARELHDDTIQALIALQQRIELADESRTETTRRAARTWDLDIAEQCFANILMSNLVKNPAWFWILIISRQSLNLSEMKSSESL